MRGREASFFVPCCEARREKNKHQQTDTNTIQRETDREQKKSQTTDANKETDRPKDRRKDRQTKTERQSEREANGQISDGVLLFLFYVCNDTHTNTQQTELITKYLPSQNERPNAQTHTKNERQTDRQSQTGRGHDRQSAQRVQICLHF